MSRPVPRGFNALIARQAARAVEIIRGSVVPVFRADPMFAPTFEGSGVLAILDDRHYLVTAAHVLDAMTDGGVHLLAEGRETQPLSPTMHLTVASTSGRRTSDLVDLGLVPLKAEEVDALGRTNFIRVQMRVASTGQRWHLRYLLLGFPTKDQLRFDDELLYRVAGTYYTAAELSTGKYKAAGLDPEECISIEFNDRRIAGPKGRGGKPNFSGMSGGGIWEINPHANYSAAKPPRLVGLLAGLAPRNNKALFGASTTSWIALARSVNPHEIDTDRAAAG